MTAATDATSASLRCSQKVGPEDACEELASTGVDRIALAAHRFYDYSSPDERRLDRLEAAVRRRRQDL